MSHEKNLLQNKHNVKQSSYTVLLTGRYVKLLEFGKVDNHYIFHVHDLFFSYSILQNKYSFYQKTICSTYAFLFIHKYK